MKYITRILIALVALAILSSCTADDPDDTPTPSHNYPYTVTTPDGTDITARVTELWDFANDLYAPPPQGGTDTLYSVRTGYLAYQSIEERFETRRDYFTTDGMAQLDAARDGDGNPVFYTRNATTYRRPDMMSEMLPGDITDITTLSTTADRITLSIEYTDPMWWRTDRLEVLESDRRYVNLTIAFSEGVWKIDDYVYPDMTDGISYTGGDYPDRYAYVPLPTHNDMLRIASTTDEHRNACRRVHLLQNLGALGIDRTRVDPDDLTYTHLYLWHLTDEDGNEYLIDFLNAEESREHYPDIEDPPLIRLVARTDKNGDWQPASEEMRVDDETAARAADLLRLYTPRFEDRDGAPPSNITVFRTNDYGYYLAFADTTSEYHDGRIDLIYTLEMFSVGFGVSNPLARLDGEWTRVSLNYGSFPSRSDLLAPCYDSTLLREMRRVYFMENCWGYGIGSANIIADTIVWENDATFTFSTVDEEKYSVTFLPAYRLAELPSNHEIFELTQLSPSSFTHLTADDLDFFNTEYFNTHESFSNRFLTSTYSRPQDIDLEMLFYEGFADTADLTADELAFCEQNGFTTYLDIQRTTSDEMRAILEQYTGLSDGFSKNLDKLLYNPDTDAYYHNHSDTNRVTPVFTSGTYYSNGRLILRYTASALPSNDSPMELTLKHVSGTEFLFISNLPA